MNATSDRLREHPEDRFSASQHAYDLAAVGQTLIAEKKPSSNGHRQETLYKGSDVNKGPTTVALFAFDKGAHLARHIARGVVTIHVIEGHMRVMCEGTKHQLKANHVLVLRPEVEHELYAEQDSRMLLTVCLEERADG